MDINSTLEKLQEEGNYRKLPSDSLAGITDFTSNDYLGLAGNIRLREDFFATRHVAHLEMSASASRLLGGSQSPFTMFEQSVAESYGYGRQALFFNSGYHANTGIVSALADNVTLIVADKLVHASIIDGIKLSGAPFQRFRHNDMDHLGQILEKEHNRYSSILVIVESVYSMDGDRCNLRALAALKRRFPTVALYVDEAHAVGVCGPGGLGLCAAEGILADIDILVGTLGKALASAGAFVLCSPRMKEFLINRARPLIFSTALPPIMVEWSHHVWKYALEADTERERLAANCRLMAEFLPGEPSHIRPLIVGNPSKAMALSEELLREGFKVLPIRRPTVPPGTERLRFSLSSAIAPDEITRLGKVLSNLS